MHIKNVYLYAKNCLPAYVRMGKEFELHDSSCKPGELATVIANLYGLGTTAAKQWHAHLADTLRSIGFRPSWHNMDIWICRRKQRGKGYEYVGTHTHNLMVVSRDPEANMDKLQEKYQINKIQ